MQNATAIAASPASGEKSLFSYLALGFGIFWILSFLGTTDLVNWYIENLLVVLFVPVLLLTRRRFQFSDRSYACIFVFLVLHVYGAKYAYADNPFGFWLKEHLHTVRNPYDRLVHFSFGFLLAGPMRDLFLNRFNVSSRASWILPVEVTLSLSALFELIEWSIADVFCPAHGQNYVGTQGDIWDAQKDMFMATCGAALVMLISYLISRRASITHSGKVSAITR